MELIWSQVDVPQVGYFVDNLFDLCEESWPHEVRLTLMVLYELEGRLFSSLALKSLSWFHARLV